jgi:hypothetical protein
MRYFPEPIDDFDLIYRMNGWRKAAVDAEDLVIDNNAQREEIKHIRVIVPDIGIAIFSSTFRVETK